jgi:hypothetical protein
MYETPNFRDIITGVWLSYSTSHLPIKNTSGPDPCFGWSGYGETDSVLKKCSPEGFRLFILWQILVDPISAEGVIILCFLVIVVVLSVQRYKHRIFEGVHARTTASPADAINIKWIQVYS